MEKRWRRIIPIALTIMAVAVAACATATPTVEANPTPSIAPPTLTSAPVETQTSTPLPEHHCGFVDEGGSVYSTVAQALFGTQHASMSGLFDGTGWVVGFTHDNPDTPEVEMTVGPSGEILLTNTAVKAGETVCAVKTEDQSEAALLTASYRARQQHQTP